MNSVSLSGRVSGQAYFNWLSGRQQGKQAFLVFHLHLRGPRKERDSSIRVCVYGRDAEFLYPQLRHGVWVEVAGRYRERENPRAFEQTTAQVTDLIRNFDAHIDAPALAQQLCEQLQARLTKVAEVVALPNKIRAYPDFKFAAEERGL